MVRNNSIMYISVHLSAISDDVVSLSYAITKGLLLSFLFFARNSSVTNYAFGRILNINMSPHPCIIADSLSLAAL